MALEMHKRCKTCGQGLAHDDAAFICSHECTYCPACVQRLRSVCPTCAGEIVARPRRRVARAGALEESPSS
jgi:hypothetical protein